MTPDLPAHDPSGLGPMVDLHVLASVLGSDRADVASYARVLSGALADALPAGMVEVEYRRGLGDRVAGRPGRAVALLVHGADRQLALAEDGRGGVAAQIRQVVRGIVIGRRDVGVDEWLRALAEDLNRLAARDATARRALEDLLQGRA